VSYYYILFDADGTLFDFDNAEMYALSDLLAKYGVEITEERHALYREINRAKWRGFEAGEITREQLQSSRFRELFGSLGRPDVDAETANAEYLDLLADGSHLTDGALEVCRSLYGRCELAIVTNGIARSQIRRVGKSEIRKYISKVFVSEEIGFSKPNPLYFEYVLGKMQITDKPSVLVVGDSLGADILGGAKSGLDTCWFNPRGVANDTGAVPTYEIRSLRELTDIVI
jgi:2-haloacid dehalogenase